ncbi:PLxRFG domain-containing protein [Enterovibrio norvegicus]|uniref:PLxRFG domain-containing protein n=1 Tax=Enterovibrio norvegicus TaxID=188144 RepID=UPI003899F3E5
MPNDTLGNNPDATVNGRTDKTFELPEDFDLRAYAPTKNLEVTAGDSAKAVAIGAMNSVEGGAEVVSQTQNFLGDTARELGVPDALIEAANYTPQGLAANYMSWAGDLIGEGSDWIKETLTEDGKEALETMPITEAANGSWKLSTDPAVWGMQLSQGVGYLVPTVASAIATGGMSLPNAVSSLTNMAVRSGARPEVASKAAKIAVNLLQKSPTAAVSMTSDLGAQGQQSKDSILNMSFDDLLKSEVFTSAFMDVDTDPEFALMSDLEKLEEARARVANGASQATMTDPLSLGASVAATLVGDVPLANALVRGTGKGIMKGAAIGAVREAPTEALQGGVEQYVSNKVSNEFAGTDKALMDGVALGAANEAAIGGVLGGGMGAAGGVRAAPQISTEPTQEPVMSESDEQVAPEASSTNIEPESNEPETPAPAADIETVISSDSDAVDPLADRRAKSQEVLRQKQVLSDPADHDIQLLKLAYAFDADKTDAALDRIEQGDISAEREIYALAEQASALGIDETGVQQAFDAAVAKRQAGQQSGKLTAKSKAERYITAIEQGRQNLTEQRDGVPTYKPYKQPHDPRIEQAQSERDSREKPQRDFNPDIAKSELRKREANAERAMQGQLPTDVEVDPHEASLREQAAIERAEQPQQNDASSGGVTRPFQREQAYKAAEGQRAEQQAQREHVDENVDQSRQAKGEFSNRPGSMKLREKGKIPLSDVAAISKKTKPMRKRLSRRMAHANPRLKEALLESLRNAPERLAAFDAEAKRRQDAEDAKPENKVRRAKAEALFTHGSDTNTEPEFSPNAIKKVMDDLRSRGENLIRELPKAEQQAAREDLRKAEDFVKTRLSMMRDETRANRTKTLKDFTPRYQPGNRKDEPSPVNDEVSTEPNSEAKKSEAKDSALAHRIDDVGEKIGGARKDIWGAYADSIKGETPEEIQSLTLSNAWPQPNYIALLEQGVSLSAISLFRAMRDSIPPKPRRANKLVPWAYALKRMRDVSMAAVKGALTPEEVTDALKKSSSRDSHKVMGRAALYDALGHSHSLAHLSLTSGHYSMFKGETFDPPKTVWTVERSAKGSAYGNWPRLLSHGDTQDAAIEGFKAQYEKLMSQPKKRKSASFDVYTKRSEPGYFVGKKVGRSYIDLAGPIDNLGEARRMVDEDYDALTDKLDAAKFTPPPRRDTNDPRVGEDMREGKDVSAEDFAKTFGFRGVEFGNWVEQGKRQAMVNDAYDALMDMAAILGISPKAISLNGELGLAFGARGRGGVDPAAAHYEPGKVVINLTKKHGAGSLGHEWWHALDNYFAKLDVGSDKPSDTFMTSNTGTYWGKDHQVRVEMRDAFMNVMTTIGKTDLKARSMVHDRKRNKDYWSTPIEMSARAFESYLIAKLADQNASNDFLANIASESAWKHNAIGSDVENAYPYPTASESLSLRRSYDRLFNTIEQHAFDDGRVMLYSREGVSTRQGKGMSVKHAQLGVQQWIKEYRGGAGVKVQVVKTQQEAEALLGESFPDATLHAFYHGGSGQVVVVADNIDSIPMLRQKLRHEILVHHGLRAVVGDSEYQKILERIHKGRNSPALKPLWDKIQKDYADKDPVVQVEEVLAHVAELDRNTLQQWWDRIVEAIAHALRKVGLIRPSDITQAEMNNIIQTLVDRVKSVNHWSAQSKSSQENTKQAKVMFSRVPSDAPMIWGEPIKGATYKEIRVKAQAKGFQLAGKEYVNKRSGITVNVGKAGIKHTMKGAMPDLAASIPYTGELIQEALYLGAVNESKGNSNVIAHHFFGARFQVEGRVHDVVIDVREMPDGKFYYDHSFERDNSASGGNSSGPRLHTRGPIVPGEGAEADSKTVTPDDDDVKFSLSNSMTFEEALKQVEQDKTPGDRFKSVLNAVGLAVKGTVGGKAGLGAVSLRQLSDLASDKLPMVKTYVDTVHRMLTRRNQMAFESAEIAQDIRKWAAKNQHDADTMFGLAHQATVEGVDPDGEFVSAAAAIERRIEYVENINKGSHKTQAQTDELKELRSDLVNEPRRQAKHTQLKRQFDRLPVEAKTHYRSMRDNYKTRHNDYRRLLEQQIQNADIDGRRKKKQIAELRTVFDLQEVHAPYFPLTRFGKYWLSSVDENGEKRYMMFDSEMEQVGTAERLRKQGFDVDTGYRLDGNAGINGASLSFVTDFIGKVDGTSLNEAKKEEIKDAIYQLYLQALPSRSMRKQFLHRKKVKGWSNDALRAMASNMMKGAYQLARMEFSDELTKHANDASKAAGVSGDNQAGRYAEELLKRHEWVMNPQHSSVAQHITSLGFVWMLGVSPAAAAINTTQNFVVALPILSSKFGSVKAAGALTQTMKEFVTSKGKILGKLNGYEEKDAYQQWHDMGLLDATNAHDLAGMAEAENWQYNENREKVMGWVSWLFHKAEVFNRETTAIAAYRLSRQKGVSHEASVKAAADMTWDAHFDYTNANRARYMQSPSMKVITQFKQYSQNMTYYLLRNLYVGFRGATTEEKRAARKQLVGTLGVTALLGGASAMPLGMLYALANALNSAFGDDDEPWDAEIEFKAYLSEFVGKEFSDAVLYGAGGAGLSPRISLDGLWVRDPNRDLEGQDLWTHYAQQIAGPVLGGVVMGAIRGGQDISEGRYWRGIEKTVPKFVRDPMKAFRYEEEGALNYRGDAYKEQSDFMWHQLLLQGFGFSDHDLMKQYEQNNAIKGYEKHILERRRDLMTAYWLATKQADTALMLDVKKQIGKFNGTHKAIAIDAKALRRSMKARHRASQENQKGIRVRESLRDLT